MSRKNRRDGWTLVHSKSAECGVWLANIFPLQLSVNHRQPISWSFNEWSAVQISIGLTHIDYKALCRVPVRWRAAAEATLTQKIATKPLFRFPKLSDMFAMQNFTKRRCLSAR